MAQEKVPTTRYIAVAAASMVFVGLAAWAAWPSAAPEPRGEELETLRARVTAMERQIASLERDLGALKRDADASPSSVTSTKASRPRAEVAAAPKLAARAEQQAAAAPLVADEPEVREKLSEMVRDELEIEREERRLRREVRMEERLREETQTFAQEVGLDDAATEKLSTLLVDERKKLSSLWQKVRDGGGDAKEIPTMLETMRAETDAVASEFLGADQYEAYAKRRADEAERWGRRFR